MAHSQGQAGLPSDPAAERPAPAVRGRGRWVSNRCLMLMLVAVLVCAAAFYAREVGVPPRRAPTCSAARRRARRMCRAPR